MSRPRTLPDPEVLEREIRRYGATQVAKAYGVTKQAVSKAHREWRLGIEPRVSYKAYIPWRVKAEHNNAYPQRMLRLYGDRQMGRPLSAAGERSLAKFVAGLEENDVVVHYDRDYQGGTWGGGWMVTPRRPGIDTGLIRVPTA